MDDFRKIVARREVEIDAAVLVIGNAAGVEVLAEGHL